jgi:hypothetical protein
MYGVVPSAIAEFFRPGLGSENPTSAARMIREAAGEG